ncbi:MAG TPA: pilus assembly protein PilM [Candidatus Hydrogenedentes bacterium]|nr:pilus assembly protein PilM [Candidatus Hydrogenedentota bacterium]HPG66197.1 pilus assembly protein PilM [Candidatus Hydrogenedentota bacterium]
MGVRATVGAIEIVGNEVRLAVVKTGGKRPKVLELHACRARSGDRPPSDDVVGEGEGRPAPVDPFDALAAAIQALVRQVKKRPVTYVLCVSSGDCVARTLTVPFRGRRRIAAAVPFELEPYLAFPIDDLSIDFVTARQGKSDTDVLAVGFRRDFLAKRLAVLEAGGIEPEGVAVDGAGLTALWLGETRRPKGLNAVVHVREGNSVFAVTIGRSLAYLRHLGVAAAAARANPMALVREIRNSLRAFATTWRGDESIERLAVTGLDLFEEERSLLEAELQLPVRYDALTANVPGIRRALRAATDEHAKIQAAGAEPAPILDVDPETVIKADTWAAVLGVTCGASGGAVAFDFRKGDLAWPHVARSVTGHVIFSSCLALLVLLGVGWYFHQEANKNLDQAAVLSMRIEDLGKQVDEMQASGLSVDLELFSDPPLLDILAELGEKMPDSKVRIKELKMGGPGMAQEWISIVGEVKDESVFAEIVDALRQSTLFRIVDEPDYRMEGGVSTFRIKVERPTAKTGEAEAGESGTDEAEPAETETPKTEEGTPNE